MDNQLKTTGLVLSSTQLYIIIGIAAFLVLLLIINIVLCFVLRNTLRKWQLEKERSSLITRLNMVEEELGIPFEERHVLVTYGVLERISKGTDFVATLTYNEKDKQEIVEGFAEKTLEEEQATDIPAEDKNGAEDFLEDLDEEASENVVEESDVTDAEVAAPETDDNNQNNLFEEENIEQTTDNLAENENVTEDFVEDSEEEASENVIEENDVTDDEFATTEADDNNQNMFNAGIELAVKDMTDVEKLLLDLVDEQYADKTYLVQYTKSFMAKLRLADEETKKAYCLFMQEVSSFKNMKADISFNQQRVHKGREAVATMLFKGKKLCIAFALNPEDYAETKYRGKNVGNTKRFEKTPMMLKITSERKGKYARHLLGDVANMLGLEQTEPQAIDFDLKEVTTDDMLLSGEMRIKVLKEVTKEDADQ